MMTARTLHTGRKRQENDWYPTPADVTEAVLPLLGIEGAVWEPCCGDGAMARVLERAGLDVVATDLHDRGWGRSGPEFDLTVAPRLLAPNVVTNPPFGVAARIIERMERLRPRVMALLLKSTFWHAAGRTDLFRRYPPAAIHALNWRPDFLGLGGPTMEVAWFVWREGHRGPTAFDVLARPCP